MFLVGLFFLLFPSAAVAQEKLFLAVTYYETLEQKSALFDYSTQVLNYFEGDSAEKTTFLSLITGEQQQILARYGLLPEILDNDTDLSRYVLLSSPHPQYQIQTNELNKIGEIFILSRHHVLLRLQVGKTFIPTGEAAKLVRIPFPEKYVKPDIVIKPISPTSIILSPTIQKPTSFLLLFLLVVSFFISFLLTGFILRKKLITDKFISLAIFVVIAGLTFILSLFIVTYGIVETKSKNDLELKNIEEF